MDDDKKFCTITELPVTKLYEVPVPDGIGGTIKFSGIDAGLNPVVKLDPPIVWVDGDENSEKAAAEAMARVGAVIDRAARAMMFEAVDGTHTEMRDRGGFRPKYDPEGI